jgi:hypothetical protein
VSFFAPDQKMDIHKSLSYIVSGCIGIIKSTQQLTINHAVLRPARQQSTVNSQQFRRSATGIDITQSYHNLPACVHLAQQFIFLYKSLLFTGKVQRTLQVRLMKQIHNMRNNFDMLSQQIIQPIRE